MEDKRRLQLKPKEQYLALTQSGVTNIEGISDAESFSTLKESLRVFGIPSAEQFQLFSVLSAILSLQNILFLAKGEKAEIQNMDTVVTAADLLGFSLHHSI